MTRSRSCAWCDKSLEHRDVGIVWNGRRYCSRTCSECHRKELARIEWTILNQTLDSVFEYMPGRISRLEKISEP